MRWPEVAKKRQKRRRDLSAYKTLIETPSTVSFGMPANADIYLLSVAGCAAGTSAATIGSRNIKTPLLAAGERMHAGYFEKSAAVAASAGFEVQIDTGLGVYATIGVGA